MEALVVLLWVTAAGGALVVGLAQLLRLIPRAQRLRTGWRWVASHTLIICAWLALAPWYIAAERAAASPYGDVYVPFILVPGIHIYQPTNEWFGRVAFPWLLGHMDSFPASVICVVVGPGLTGLLAGGLQWYLLGVIWDRLTRQRPEVEPPAAPDLTN